ncbi:helix-hairpin-helix domain-containing protein [Bacillus sp. FJAT-27231]|uniref:helix-hairpin-helix domain-containing protein n=1 Tax=Bacillus sp. FJAT-27231 TaxID=1679168 RepID=UPI000A913E67|nr:helix-hairpin-helix domain-containing protein [Bacillus sp. FJAT-27231]
MEILDLKTMVGKYKVYFLIGGILATFGLYQLTGEETPPAVPILEESVQAEQSVSPPLTTAPLELQEPAVLMVDIKGAVASPGIYSLKNGERIHDAIEKAGGFQQEADRTAINLAQKLQDEMVVYVPKNGEEPPAELPAAVPRQGSTQGNSSENGGSSININQASAEELQQLPGIGKAKAQAIIEYRETTGAFSKPEDLKNVSGIGEKTFEKMASLVVVQ